MSDLQKTLKRFAIASGNYNEFYELSLNFLKKQKVTIHKLIVQIGCTDLETFYNYQTRLNRLQRGSHAH